MAFPTFKQKLPKPQLGGINAAATSVTEKREDVKKMIHASIFRWNLVAMT